MSLTKKNFISIKVMFFFLLISVIGCKSTTNIKEEPSNKNDYQAIRSNVARLQKMLVGEFVQHSQVKDNGEFKTWLVNDNQDSVMMYSFPVGNPNKIGYWIYHYQIMTSLPDEPIYEAFEELVELSRDSIKSIYHEVPKDFNLPLKELIKNYKTSFQEVDLNELSIDEDGGSYVRQNMLFFKNETAIIKLEGDPNYIKDIYAVYPTQIVFSSIYYKDSEGKKFKSQVVSKFMKLSTFN